ncbi:MAG: hypothetical protein R6U98_04595 [Pirellulaceae bacterium]
MKKRWRYVVGVIPVASVLALATCAAAETCKLETKRIESAVTRTSSGAMSVELWFRTTRSQSFFEQTSGPEGMIRGPEKPGVPEFSEVIKKEPSQYNAEHVFRGVVKLGSQYFGFAFDTSKKAGDGDESEEKGEDDQATKGAKNPLNALVPSGSGNQAMNVVAYDRLYFDLNHNGDLTDDEVIESEGEPQKAASYARCSFPVVDLTIEFDGKKTEYAFRMSVYSRGSSRYSYANASLSAAVYREGEMEIDGKTYRVVVVDFNSNGRFDDRYQVDDRRGSSDGPVYPRTGDMLYVIDPEAEPPRGNVSPYDPSSNRSLHYVTKLVNLDGDFFDLAITPAGDELTLEPSSLAVGHVTNPNEGYRAVVYGEHGFLNIVGDESGKARVPAGRWKLASYTIEKADTQEPEEAESGSLLDSFKRALLGGARPAPRQRRDNRVSAQANRDYQEVVVKKGETVELPFGEPYRPVVSIGGRRGQREVSLSLALVGQGGERCSSMYVDGSRPGKPEFTIRTADGEVVESGNFEYG